MSVNGDGALHWAVAQDERAKLESLLKKEEAKNALIDSFYQGFTPLMIASSLGRGEMCRILMSSGADQHIKNAEGISAGEMAKDDETRIIFDEISRI